MSKYWKKWHLQGANGEPVENSILFLAYLYLMALKNNNVTEELLKKCKDALKDFEENPYNLSHDNVTGYKSLFYMIYGVASKKRFTKWWRRLHPRDWCFYSYIKAMGKPSIFRFWHRFISTLFVPVFYYSVKFTFKTEPGETSGKLLAWLRIHVIFGSKKADLILNDLINGQYISFLIPLRIYFKKDNHYPTLIEAKEYYSKQLFDKKEQKE